jgi:hypothetical protein
LVNGSNDVLGRVPTASDHHLWIDRPEIACRPESNFIRTQREQRCRALGDVRDDEHQLRTSALEHAYCTNCLFAVATWGTE